MNLYEQLKMGLPHSHVLMAGQVKAQLVQVEAVIYEHGIDWIVKIGNKKVSCATLKEAAEELENL